MWWVIIRDKDKRMNEGEDGYVKELVYACWVNHKNDSITLSK